MNPDYMLIDNSRQQYQMLGNQQLEKKNCSRKLSFDGTNSSMDEDSIDPLKLTEGQLLRKLIKDMTKSGRTDDAFDMICDTIDKMQIRIKELEDK